ncbi:MAG: glycogen synthase [Candidatus Izemoplasmatales bacterium]|jgi:starch synthase|nr:glycogen synthase [Candidatus Izemoplasmatales bacterium]
MNILNISAECFPFIKIGGLADVVGSLPGEIKRLGNAEVRVMMPKYKAIPKKFDNEMTHLCHFTIELGDKLDVYVGVETLKKGNILYYFIDNQFYFGSRDQVYGYGDESERYAFFQKAALESLDKIGFMPDLVHVHDWHTGMIPLLLKVKYPALSKIKTILSIHNLAYQGIYPISDYHYFNMQYDGRFEYEGFLNFLKSGIVSADFLSTVSKTYAEEILTDYFGYGMQKLLKARKDRLQGILNGISYKDFNPENDNLIALKYDLKSVKVGKLANKTALYKKLNIHFDSNKPTIAIISRLVSQKGIDLIKRVFNELLNSDDFTFIVLGDGEKEYVDYFRSLESTFKDKVKVVIGYSNELAHLIYAGADMFLMPSKFEPCGLGQIIALKYGTIPIVRETGGLVDTVIPFNIYEQKGTGFSFSHFNAHDMMFVIRYALQIYHKDPSSWDTLIQNAMSMDFGWNQSAKAYKKLYRKILRE